MIWNYCWIDKLLVSHLKIAKKPCELVADKSTKWISERWIYGTEPFIFSHAGTCIVEHTDKKYIHLQCKITSSPYNHLASQPLMYIHFIFTFWLYFLSPLDLHLWLNYVGEELLWQPPIAALKICTVTPWHHECRFQVCLTFSNAF